MDRTEFLRQLPYFAELPDEDLRRLCANAPDRRVPDGELLLEEGAPGDAMYVVAEGRFEVFRTIEGRDVEIDLVGVGEVLGEMSLLERRPRAASARALGDAHVIEISDEVFRELTRHPSAALAMLDTVLSRMRELEAALRESEQQAALGRMAAGLMHELNNPAAAVRRSAQGLNDVLPRLERAATDLARAEAFDVDRFPSPPGPPPADALTRSDREEEIAAWLARHGAPRGRAGELVAAGWHAEALEAAIGDRPENELVPLVEWLAARHTAEQLSDELRTGGTRIAELVGAVKGYAYVGQTLVPDLDVNETIRQTLVVMRHKLRDVEVVEDLGDLPTIEGYGSELTQVWTNLIDNAIDAMEEADVAEPRLTIRSYTEDRCVVIEVSDDGPGVPPDVRDRMFQPFFTTKPPGVGTGLGLHTVYSVVARHGGSVDVATGEDGTTFTVRLPRQVPTREG